MKPVGTRGQQVRDFTYDASGTITAGGTSQLIIPERKSCSWFTFENISDADMYIEVGGARATATLTSGKVSSIAITNGGFGYTVPPIVEFLGGGNDGWNMQNSAFLGCGQPGYPAPKHPATGQAVLTGGVVTSITIDDPGANYKIAPYILITNSPNDPFGCANPFHGSTVSGNLVTGGGYLYPNSAFATTDPISVYCATTGKAFTFKWTD